MMDAVIRIGFFIGAFAVMAWWETRSPRRQLSESRQARWIANLGLVAIDAVAVRLVLAAGVTGFAANIEGKGYGLFGALDWPRWIEIILCIIALDLIIYLQHAAFHFLPALWRLHVVHHTDLDFDLTTAVRFHPIEIVLSAGVKLLAVLALGAPAIAVLAFEVGLNATAMFNHANVRIPGPIDRALRLFVVTPDMHRVHHSVIIDEMNSNFGFNLPWWDRIFGTYVAQPEKGHQQMPIGTGRFRKQDELGFWSLLVFPFTENIRQR